ncbi:MAG: radical SAM protein, partial [Anaerolineales bacterium]|nr:radical SAM protein [Anaerolineales bacterium]
KGHRHVFDRLALAKQYIPYVMVEMPVLPGTFNEMKAILLELERLEIFSINLLEFCYPFTNTEIFKQRGFKVKNPPHQVLYNYWYAGGLPISRSELECLDLMKFSIDEGLKIGVHYCSLENKHSGQIYQQNYKQPVPETSYFSHKDYLLKSAKVFGQDIPAAVETFKAKNYQRYSLNQEHNFLEFHVGRIKLLYDTNTEIGISSSVIEDRDGEKVIRELKVDLTTPADFDLSSDV